MTAQLERLRHALSDQYVIEREIGRGGSSHVYLAADIQRNERVALKVLRPELATPGVAARFVREVEICRRLEHPNILPVLSSAVAGDELYYTMPFIQGPTLRSLLTGERQLPLPRALAIAREVAEALQYAHSRGVIHRDIKPANILIGGDGRAIVADFGIARAMIVASGEQLTSSGLVIGTPEYMSPEQANAAGDLDGRADIYALGCVLYEMLGGEPPFTGPSAQAIIARHCMEAPRSLRIIRPSVPVGVERLIMKALAKVAADRFATGAELIEAVEAVDMNELDERGTRRRRFVARIATSSLIGAAAVLAIWRFARPTEVALDPRRIVVFPLRDDGGITGRSGTTSVGEEVSTYIGYALEETRPLKWLEAIDLVDRGSRGEPLRVTPKEAHRVSARAAAAYYIDGDILRAPDSLTVVLRLHAVNGDSVIKKEGATGPASAYAPQLGVSAVARLLTVILEPGHAIDLRPSSERNVAAIANFLQGEHEYRRMEFEAALGHYEAAVGRDSAFAVAAFRGAQAATWLSKVDTSLLRVALRRQEHLSVSQALLAKGLAGYLTGNADSAVFYIRSAIRADSTLPAAWTLLGEVYARSLTSEPAADSISRASLQRAVQLDPEFAPTLVLQEEIAFQEGNVAEVERLRGALRQAGAATTHATERDLMYRCVRDGPSSVRWADAMRRDPEAVLDAARILSRRAAQPVCARDGFTAVLQSDSATTGLRWGALLGLHGLFVARGRSSDFRSVRESTAARRFPISRLYLATAAVNEGFEREARWASDSLAERYEKLTPTDLWLLGAWAGHTHDANGVRRAAARLKTIADSAPTRLNVLLARLIEARVPLALGDTDAAIDNLKQLKPTGPRSQISWQHAEGLGAERLLLAELLFARHRFAESYRVASLLDATEPVPYLLYLRPSLEIRRRAAAKMRNGALAAQVTQRLRALDST
jgi:tRNA A-37 threonylcarbamoyl transferase component Bud32